MKRFVNARLPVLLVFALVAGILLGYLFMQNSISLFFVIAIVPVTAVTFIICFIFSRKRLLIFSILAIIFLTVGTIEAYLKLDSFNKKELVNGDYYSISATVCDKGIYDSGEYIVVNNVKANGRKIGGKIRVYLSPSYGEYCAVGYKVNFTANISTYDTFPYGKLSFNALSNIKYSCRVHGGLTSAFHFSLFGSINTAIRNALYDNLDYDTASVTYAMLTGNTDGIEDGSISAFRYGGIAHLFAVSGLHIGLIYGLLRLLCKKLHPNRYIGLAICIVPVFLYSGICGFTLSSVRALIMCTVAAISGIIYTKYDALNSLSLSAATILLLNPLNLFNVGFQLSLGAISAIVMLSKNIVRPFKKVPENLKATVGISLSAQAGTMPVMLARFGYLSGAGILLNILIIPLLSAFFAIIFVATFLAVVLPFIAPYILPLATVPLEATVSFLVNAGFERNIISGFGAGLFVPVYFFGLFALSDKFNLKLKYRLISVISASAFLCTYIPLMTFSPFGGYKIIASAYYGGGEVLFKSRNTKILVVTENLNLSRTDDFLNRYYSSDIDALIILGGENCAMVYGNTDLKCDAYIFGEYINIQPFRNKNINYENKFNLGGIQFEFVDGYSLIAEYNGETIGVCAGNCVPFDYCDYLFTDSQGECNTKTLVSFNERILSCIYDCGDFVFRLE